MDGSRLVPALVLEKAKMLASKCALSERARAMTFEELITRADRLARRLRGHGVARDVVVAICAHPGADMVAAQLAILLAGGAFLPLDPRYPLQRLSYMLEDSAAHVLLTGADVALTARSTWPLAAALQPLTSEEEKALPLAWDAPSSNDLAYLLYTSGSTGRPKGVMVEHDSFLNYVLWDIEAFAIEPRDRTSQVIAPSFDMSVWEIWPTLAAGGSLHFADRQTYARPGALFRWLAEEAITQCILPTPLAESLLKERLPKELCLRLMLVAGDRLRSYKPKGAPFRLFNLYGPTETTMNVTYGEVAEEPGEPGRPPHIGRAIANVTLEVLDENLEPVAHGSPGELYVGGRCLARGYHGMPALTSERFVANPRRPNERLYRTGDLVRWRDDGNLDFLGRLDHQVKIRGHRIELGEIEATLSAHSSVRVALVSATPEQCLEAHVVFRPEVVRPSATDLEECLSLTLPEYMIPRRWSFLDELPLTPNGKVDRTKLPSSTARAPQEVLRGALETKVADAWARTLAVDTVEADSNFFALGGHSIAAIGLLARIERDLSVTASMRDLVEAPTLREFCARLRGLGVADLKTPSAISAEPHSSNAPFPLTDVQYAYWVGRQAIFGLGNIATHLYFEVEGNLDVTRLEAALRRLIAHHPMLRAVIRDDGTQQVLADVPPYTIRTYDLRSFSEREREAHLSAIRDEMSHQVLPASEWPLFDIRTTVLADHAVRVHLSFDALILDAQSLFRIFDEWHRLYVDPERKLVQTETTYRDYVLALQALRESRAYAAAATYWRDRTSTLPDAPALPLSSSPDKINRPRFTRRRLELSPEAWRAIRDRAHAAGVTETVALLTAYADVLAAFSKTPHFNVNLTLFNRLSLTQDVDQIVGDFTSITLLEIDAAGAASFALRAERLQTQLWRDLDHRLYSGVQVLRDCHAKGRRISAPVVFTSELGFAELGRDTQALDRFGSEVTAITQTPQVWIDLQVVERGGALVAYWDAVEDLFPVGVLDEMTAAFVRKCELLREDAGWNAAGWIAETGGHGVPSWVFAERLLHDAFIEQAKSNPDRLAIVSNGTSLTYGETLALATRTARAVRERVDGEEDLIAVALPRGFGQVVAVLGILMAGAAYVPLDPDWPETRRNDLIRRSGARVVVTNEHLAGALNWPKDVQPIRLEAIVQSPAVPSEAGARRKKPDALAYVIYTSGSTGQPKGVAIEHRSAVNTIEDINERLGLGPDDRTFAISPLAFDLSVFDIFGPLSAGGAVVIPSDERRKDPVHWRECVAEHGVTVWNSVPTLVELLIDGAEPRSAILRSLRWVLMSGDWIPVSLPDRVRGLHPRVQMMSLGGATEGSIWSVARLIESVDPAWRSIPYGRALRHQMIDVLDAQMGVRPDWAIGELYIGGAGVARGYYGDPERTAASFVVHPQWGKRLYRTGDLGRRLPTGEIEFLGREDGQVKIRGHRVEIGEVEAAIGRHAGVKACAVVPCDGPNGRTLVAAVVVADAGLTPADVRADVARLLPDYMVPSRVDVLDTLPFSPNGKVDRTSLLQHLKTTEPEPRQVVESAAEREVQKIWSDLLGRPIELLDVSANFFDSGGDSVSAVRLRVRLEEKFGRRVPIAAVFEHATIRSQATLLCAPETASTAEGTTERARRRKEALTRLVRSDKGRG